jgi:hypothetical protein
MICEWCGEETDIGASHYFNRRTGEPSCPSGATQSDGWKLALLKWMLDRIDFYGDGFFRDERDFIVEWYWSLDGRPTPSRY